MATKKKPIEELVEEQAEPTEEHVEETAEPVVVSDAPEFIDIIVARPDDSYASLGVQYAPAGVKAHDFAQHLYNFNAGAVVRAGARIRIPR